LVSPDVIRRLKALRATVSYEVILLNPVTANAQSTYQFAILIQRKTTREEDDPALIL
jgi:hypothetical protein